MNEKLAIGVIGCGEISWRSRSPGIAAAKNATHVMVTDIRPELAQNLGGQYEVPWTTDLADFLANPAVEAVYISVPHYLHAPLTIQALRAGKHVLVEKPIATALADADAMIAAAKEQDRILSVAYDAQVNPTMIQLRQMIAAGMLGQVTGLRIVFRGDKQASYWQGGFTQRVKDDWRVSKEKAGGGPLIMNTIHDLNTMRYLTGLEAVRVYAEADNFATPVEVEDFIALTMRFNNGAIGSLEAACTLPGRDPQGSYNRIYGQRGQVILGRQGVQIFLRQAWGDLPGGEWWDMPAAPESNGAQTMMEAFAEAVLSSREPAAGHEPAAGREPAATAWDGRQGLEIVTAAYQSAESGQVVELPL